jgi:hypothetical protein
MIKRLDKEFSWCGFEYTLIKRSDKVALLARKNPRYLEVTKIYILPPVMWNGKRLPVREAVSDIEQAGHDGSRVFKFKDELKAHEYFDQLSSRIN